MKTPANRQFSLAAVILAAGRSSRMGRPKLLLPWGETSVLGHLIQQWKTLGANQIVVVCFPGDQPLKAELDRLGFPAENRTHNDAPESGMFGSIRCAASFHGWLPDLTHWAIILGDQPHLPHDLLTRVIEFAAAQPQKVSQPSRQGHGRHPVVLPRSLFLELGNSTTTTLKDFLKGAEKHIALLEVEDAAFDLDLDYPADYEEALRMRPG